MNGAEYQNIIYPPPQASRDCYIVWSELGVPCYLLSSEVRMTLDKTKTLKLTTFCLLPSEWSNPLAFCILALSWMIYFIQDQCQLHMYLWFFSTSVHFNLITLSWKQFWAVFLETEFSCWVAAFYSSKFVILYYFWYTWL